eukprot:1334985-Rhodomonas_salina.7
MPYAFAMRCRGTDTGGKGEAATDLRVRYAMSSTDRAYAATRKRGRRRVLSPSSLRALYAKSAHYAKSGTDPAYHTIPRYAIPGTDLAYRTSRVVRSRTSWLDHNPGIGLRACFAMSGTDLANVSISLRACYAISSTDLAYGATAWRFRTVAR